MKKLFRRKVVHRRGLIRFANGSMKGREQNSFSQNSYMFVRCMTQALCVPLKAESIMANE